jgi:hypothetical protein
MRSPKLKYSAFSLLRHEVNMLKETTHHKFAAAKLGTIRMHVLFSCTGKKGFIGCPSSGTNSIDYSL